jgi:sterol desaturase/sphingolipid hydroxylase (fatty acid hydroxylase superfamily)
MSDPAAIKSRPLAIDIGLIVLMIGALLAVLTAIDWFFHGALGWTFLTALLLGLVPRPLFSLLEQFVRPAGPRKSARQWLLNFQIGIFVSFSSVIAGALVATTMTATLSRHFGLGLIDLRFATGKGIAASIGALILSFIVGDFFFYWSHRLQHKSKILWQIHKLHHMDQEFDVLTDVRHSWVDGFFGALFISVPLMVLFKLDNLNPLQIGLTGGFIIGSVQNIIVNFNHFNARWHLGWATVVVCGPQMHRIHHSRLPQHIDKNFCGFFPLWDVLFGNYYAPARDEYPPTGVDGEPEIQSCLAAHSLWIREWWNMFRAWRRRRSVMTAQSSPQTGFLE